MNRENDNRPITCKYEFMYISHFEVYVDEKEGNVFMLCVRPRLLYSDPVLVLPLDEERYIPIESIYNKDEYEPD